MKIDNYELDEQQEAIVLDESNYLLVSAGAGSGKTLTILGKIKYLIKNKNINPQDILCLSFTNASSKSLKEKIKKNLNYDIAVYTFHKLAIEILKDNQITFDIAVEDTLEDIVYNFFYNDALTNKKCMRLIMNYFDLMYLSNKGYIKFLKNYSKQISSLQKLIITFINTFKCNDYEPSDFNTFLKRAKREIFNYHHKKTLLILILNIYLKYDRYLKENQELDFNDLIIEATKIVKEKGIKQYKYIIIDEFQDVSHIRFNLVREIISKTNASLMVVGDDFQSIYRFTGCDISIFLNFKKYFTNAKIMKIENTYRNSQELIKVAGSFVMKNKNQIVKQLKSNKHIKNPIQIIYYYQEKTALEKIIQKIDINNILILGRNNNDIYKFLDNDLLKLKDNKIIYKNNKNIDITYMTVHKSKGLEEEHVIIINLKNDINGFPNQIKDHKILKYLEKDYDKYPYSEERRLFYVALTRTKNYVYLLTPIKNESIFIKELKKYPLVKIDYLK